VVTQSSFSGSTAGSIAASVEDAIRDGRLVPGTRLPTIRLLAAELGVSPITVASAYRELGRRGFVVAAGRRGTRVAERPPLPMRTRRVVPAGARDLASGNPDPRLLPPLGDALSRIDVSTDHYLDEGNLPALVELARAKFSADGIKSDAIAVVGGALDGVERILEAHLRPGDVIAVEDPGFVRTFDLLRPLGLRPEPVRLDDAGPRAADLDRALEIGARAVILTPRAQNPVGAALDERRMTELRAILTAREDILVIEDDHAAGVAGAPALTVCDGDRPKWATVRSVSKSLGPDLRLAVVAGDATTVARVEGRQQIGTGWVSRVLQRIVLTFWSDDSTMRRLVQTEQDYAEHRTRLIQALADRGITAHGRSGLNVYLPVPDESSAVAGLLQRGWAVAGMDRWRIESGPAVRITTAALAPEETEVLANDIAATLAPRAATYWA
jgi:DNA-binding transcriptional MocR family regulator